MPKAFDDLTIITTLYSCSIDFVLLKRLKIFCQKSEKLNIKINIGYCSSNFIFDYLVKKVISQYSLVKLCTIECDYMNNSKLRNGAIEKTETDYIIFLDLDLWFDENLINNLYIQAQNNNYSVAPCLYLTEFGAKELMEQKNPQSIICEYLKGNIKKILHLAVPSSVICSKKYLVKKINGFDINFKGHGYEDFDFLVRFFYSIGKMNITENTLVDKTYTSPLLSEGFRAELGTFFVSNILEKNIAIHLPHKKRTKNYKEERKANADRFYQKLEELGISKLDNKLILDEFLEKTKDNKTLFKEFFILFNCIERCHFKKK